MTGNPIIGSRVTLVTSRAGVCLLLFFSIDRARVRLLQGKERGAYLGGQAVAVQVSGVSDETLPHEYSNSIVPGSLLV